MRRAKALFNHWQHYEEIYVDGSNTVEWNGERYPIDALNWAPPVKGTIYGTLLNFKEELRDMNFSHPPYNKPPEHVVMYMKPANTINRHMAAICLPEGIDELEVGAALGIVIEKTMSHVPEQDVMKYVAGYTVVNDITVPHDSYFRPDIKNKVRDGFCPVGPWIMSQEEVSDPDKLELRVSVNGEMVQRHHTGDLVRTVPRLLAEITTFMTLNPGDVVLAGIPAHPPRIKADDHVVIEIPGVGQLANTVVSIATAGMGGVR